MTLMCPCSEEPSWVKGLIFRLLENQGERNGLLSPCQSLLSPVALLQEMECHRSVQMRTGSLNLILKRRSSSSFQQRADVLVSHRQGTSKSLPSSEVDDDVIVYRLLVIISWMTLTHFPLRDTLRRILSF